VRRSKVILSPLHWSSRRAAAVSRKLYAEQDSLAKRQGERGAARMRPDVEGVNIIRSHFVQGSPRPPASASPQSNVAKFTRHLKLQIFSQSAIEFQTTTLTPPPLHRNLHLPRIPRPPLQPSKPPSNLHRQDIINIHRTSSSPFRLSQLEAYITAGDRKCQTNRILAHNLPPKSGV